MNKMKIEKWQVKNSELVLDSRWIKVWRDDCILPDGSEINSYYYCEESNFSQVFALTTENQVILVRQYKHGIKEIVLELPAGNIEATDLNPLATAQRELLEETGFRAAEWQALGSLHVSPAKSMTRGYPFLAKSAQQVCQPNLDATEAIQVLLCPIAKVLDLIVKGEIQDSNSIATCLLALRALGQI